MPRYILLSVHNEKENHHFYLVCDCHPNGIIDKQCDRKTGTCQCKPNVIGQRCDQCQVF